MVTQPHRTALMGSIPKGGVGAEVGVQKGCFSKIILREAQPKILYLVDLWERFEGYRMPKEWDDMFHLKAMCQTLTTCREAIAAGVVRPLCGLSADTAKMFAGGELDWVYIDACHTYDACMEDLKAWVPKVRRGGIVMIHDYEPRYWWSRTGTVKATNEFTKKHRVVKFGLTEDEKATFWFTKTWK